MEGANQQYTMSDPAKYLAYIYFLLTVCILGVYGARIAPYLGQESLVPFWSYTLPFIFIALLKYSLEPIIVLRVPVLMRPRRQFIFDMSLYLLVGVIIFAEQVLFFMQPQALALKMIFGSLIIGYFASIDNALSRERYWFSTEEHEIKADFNFSPISSKLSLFLTVTVFIAMSVTATVAFVDLSRFTTNVALESSSIMQIFIVDIFFVFGIILVLTLRLIHTYSHNIQHIFSTQLAVLSNVRSGNLDNYVPIVTRDEFGQVAQQINALIDELRGKEKLRDTLEKIVSPSIMEKLLTTDDSTLKYGQEYNVAILFCDLREFTSFTESCSAEDVIFFLNAYFSEMAKIVAAQGGIINKFMGDAVLAVYGLEANSNAAEEAVNTAMAMLEHAHNIDLPNGDKLEIGVGIHTGKVIAGTIGSEERYEYTFIGDAVNTASRLDGLSKRLGYRIVISQEAYSVLGELSQRRFTDLGKQVVRGKNEPVHVLAASKIEPEKQPKSEQNLN